MADILTIGIQNQAGHVLVTVAGEIDLDTAPLLCAQLVTVAVSRRALVVDLTQVGFLGAAGLNVLAEAARQAAAHGGSMYVVAPPSIRRLFSITGLDLRIPLTGTLAQALAALASRGDLPADGGALCT